ncbi:MAG: hypothetical protein ABJN11_15445 [Lentilitoribacter sp.]
MKLLTANDSFDPVRSQSPLLLNMLIILIIIAASIASMAFVLTQQFAVPIGPMYWDTNIYFDAIHRINLGQLPSVDFNTPVGPLNYWLATLLHNYFPNGHPVLIIHWSQLLITAPMMLIVCWMVSRRSLRLALGLLLPFLVFAAFPFGTVDFFPFPGVDGFGHYNRHGAILLYVTTASVFFIRNPFVQALLLALCGIALILGKITAFAAALIIVGFGFLSGLVGFFALVASLVLFAAALVGLEFQTGIISSYLQSIWDLAQSNQSVLLPKFLTVFSQRMDVVFACGLLILALFFTDIFGARNRAEPTPVFKPYWHKFTDLVSHDYFALGFVLLAGIFYETQNTGSQAFIMLWPVILMILYFRASPERLPNLFIIVLAMATVLPTFTKLTHKGLRTIAVAPTYDSLEHKNLGILGNVSAKDIFLERIEPMKEFYTKGKWQLGNLSGNEVLPSSIIFSEPDFQILWYHLMDEAIDSIYQYEAENNVKFETIFTIDFTNPFPFLMNRNAPLHVQIGADSGRTLGEMSEKVSNSVQNADIILRPTCPILFTVDEIYQIYKEAIDINHKRIRLNDCYDAFIKKAPPAEPAEDATTQN